MAINQTKNPTLRCSSGELVFGHPLRGVMHFLRDPWTHPRDQQKLLKQPVQQYLADLQQRVQIANDTAQKHALSGTEENERSL